MYIVVGCVAVYMVEGEVPRGVCGMIEVSSTRTNPPIGGYPLGYVRFGVPLVCVVGAGYTVGVGMAGTPRPRSKRSTFQTGLHHTFPMMVTMNDMTIPPNRAYRPRLSMLFCLP